jgi:hypothetical protein
MITGMDKQIAKTMRAAIKEDQAQHRLNEAYGYPGDTPDVRPDPADEVRLVPQVKPTTKRVSSLLRRAAAALGAAGGVTLQDRVDIAFDCIAEAERLDETEAVQ